MPRDELIVNITLGADPSVDVEILTREDRTRRAAQPKQPVPGQQVKQQAERPDAKGNAGRPGNANLHRDRVPPQRIRPDAAAEAKGPADAGRAFFSDGGVFVEHNTAPIAAPSPCACGSQSPSRPCACGAG